MSNHQDIKNCEIKFQFECPKKWSGLKTTDDENIRFCDHCSENVYLCNSLEDVHQHAKEKHCISVEQEDDIHGPRRLTGKPISPTESLLRLIIGIAIIALTGYLIWKIAL